MPLKRGGWVVVVFVVVVEGGARVGGYHSYSHTVIQERTRLVK